MKFVLINGTEPNDMYMFHCPGCNTIHQITVKGSRAWEWNGSVSSPTISPSILVRGKYRRDDNTIVNSVCHSYVTEGKIQFLGDCTHKLANQTIELADVPKKWIED